jgi:hypothetical protein
VQHKATPPQTQTSPHLLAFSGPQFLSFPATHTGWTAVGMIEILLKFGIVGLLLIEIAIFYFTGVSGLLIFYAICAFLAVSIFVTIKGNAEVYDDEKGRQQNKILGLASRGFSTLH